MARRDGAARSSESDDARRHAVLVRALDEIGGPLVVLDPQLRIVAVTASAERVLGERLPLGALAPKLLWGDSAPSPMAEALAAGRPAAATIPRPCRDRGERLVHVRAVPFGQGEPREGEPREGWVLILDERPLEVDPTDAPVLFHGMWTRDPAMKRMFRIVERAARSEVRVLVRGDTGAGKELVANAIHALSSRSKGPFRAINCAALPPNLLESELFGHVRGAFTGAVRDNPGHFKLADKGTLFLDEVGEMPLDLQAKMLRVVETRSVIPVGARDPVPVDVRIVAATHRALRREVEAGRFRADLMYRLRVVPIFLPPLRARRGDVLLLTQRRIDELNARGGRQVERIAPGARAALEGYDWPGNVRELKNVLEYAFVMGEGPVLVEADLPPELSAPTAELEVGAPLANVRDVRDVRDARDVRDVRDAAPEIPGAAASSPEAARILRAIERAGGSRDRAAKMLGVSRVTLWRRMRALGLLDGAGA